MNKLTQDEVDGLFFIRMGNCGDYTNKETLQLIQDTLKTIDIYISKAEAHDFWCWRSEQYDAGFLNCCEREVIEWFGNFINDISPVEDEEDDDGTRYTPYKE